MNRSLLLTRKLIFIPSPISRQRGHSNAIPELALPTFDGVARVGGHAATLLLRQHFLLLILAALQLLDALVVVVDGGGEGAFGAVLPDNKLVEVLFEDDRSDARGLVGVT